MTTVLMPLLSCAASLLIMGKINAAVFPVPVCAQAIKSLPSIIFGIACSCIGVAFRIPYMIWNL